MKWIVIAVVVALLVLAQIVFGTKKEQTPVPAEQTEQTVETATVEAAEEPAAEAPVETPAEPETKPETPAIPAPDDVAVVSAGAFRLVPGEGNEGWAVAERDGFPADGARIETFLNNLLTAERLNVMLDENTRTGLEDGGGLIITLTAKDGSECEFRLGLRPEGSYNAAYLGLPGGGTVLAAADLRGDLGLWENTEEAYPDPADWIQKTIMSFDPADAVRIEADYPDHKLVFVKSPKGEEGEEGTTGEWRAEGYVPSEDWNRDALAAWLDALADFQITDLVPPEEDAEENAEAKATHAITVTLAGGETQSVRVRPNHSGGEMLAVSSAFLGRTFRLPEWRFRKYFGVSGALFPAAAPHFTLEAVRFIDILRDGEKVKIARRDGGWEGLAVPYAVRRDAADRLLRVLSLWRPEDYASPDFRAVRPGYGAPTVEVTLDGGEVRQYRLGGRHPLFPWRYVAVDGKTVFSATNRAAEAMFPEFAEILDLGRVFHRLTPDGVDIVEFIDERAGEVGGLLFTRSVGGWIVSGGGKETELPENALNLVAGLLEWPVAGLHPLAGGEEPAPEYRLRLYGQDGLEQEILLLRPDGRDIPYLDPADNNRGYRLNGADFRDWLAAARGCLLSAVKE